MKWKDPPKAYCDCSGLINHLLMHTYSYTEDDLKNWTGSRRPTARRYHDLIDLGQSKNWKKIEKLENLKPGDLIAIKYLDAKEGDNTGHVMLVDAKPKLLNTPAETIAGAAKQWEVPVIDSTMSPHGKKDSRYDKNEKHTGVGQGTFRILTDDQGTIVGYTWSLDSSKTIYKQNVHHMLFGRLER
ncbi:C40 family peptidase [Telmatocola sphagniphila]|uniref:C40 family peptidase n=1 Tax=Telmatocola sphagniphila TaxID=1123043 RepID=A0A8E6EWM5_9BACT|nr:NlpC/P60 family protein [Telmatocola sphagniphila]QVL34135.1 C40 family peptidase [Telmatocola sphagniphila]